MIISDRHGYAFIRLHRTGSTSVSRHLNVFEDKWSDLVEQIASSEDLEMVAGKPVDPHHVPHFIAHHFIPEKLSNYFSFTFVRNPWDRFVSAWKYLQRDVPLNEKYPRYDSKLSIPFSEFIENLEKDEKPEAWQYLSLPQSHFIGSPDFTGRFETISDDLNLICETLRLPIKELKKQNSTIHKDYKEYYTAKTKNIISKLYAEDIERFKYTFE